MAAAYLAKYRAGHIAVGQCVDCTQPAVTKLHCGKHRDRHNTRRRKTDRPPRPRIS